MRGFIIMLFMFFSVGVFSQTLSMENPIVKIENREYKLIEATETTNLIAFTEFNNGKVYETGFYQNGKLHGIWKGYDSEGNVMTSIKYDNGNRVWLKTVTNNKDIIVTYRDGKPLAVTYYLASN